MTWREDGPPLTTRIRARRFDASGVAIGASFQVAEDTGTYVSVNSPRVSMADDGASVITWGNHLFDTGLVFAQLYDAAGSPSGAAISPDGSYGNCCRAVAHDGATGDFVVAWSHYSFDFETTGIRVRQFDASGSPTGPVLEPVHGTAQHFGADVAIAPSGAFAVSWQAVRYAGMGSTVYEEVILGQRFSSSGSSMGDPFQVTPYASHSFPFSRSPAIAFDEGNHMLIVWPGDSDPAVGSFEIDVFGRRTGAAKVPSIGSLGLVALALLSLAAGVRALRQSRDPRARSQLGAGTRSPN